MGLSAALEFISVHKRFGPDREVLSGLSFRIEAGEQVALLGESGVGKSTLLNLAAGLTAADSGEIRVAGEPVRTSDDQACSELRLRRIGFVFQAFHLLPHLNLWRNVALPLVLARQPLAEARERAESLLAALGLATRAESLPGELSGGEQQRVALARALVHRPALVLADEPTGNLDPATAHRALTYLDEQVRASGAALLMVTHSDQAAARSDRRLRLTPQGLETLT